MYYFSDFIPYMPVTEEFLHLNPHTSSKVKQNQEFVGKKTPNIPHKDANIFTKAHWKSY